MTEQPGERVSSLICLRCDRTVAPAECRQAPSVGAGKTWWFHSCGDSVGATCVPSGMSLRDVVSAHFTTRGLMVTALGHWEDAEGACIRCDGTETVCPEAENIDSQPVNIAPQHEEHEWLRFGYPKVGEWYDDGGTFEAAAHDWDPAVGHPVNVYKAAKIDRTGSEGDGPG